MLTFTNSRIKEIKIQYEKKNVEEKNIYIKELEQRNMELRKFKHDYKNFLLSISASLKSNDINNESIENLLNYANKNVGSNITIENSNLYKINNDLLRGIIITKLIAAKNKEISTHFEIDNNIYFSTDDEIEITRILGILLDNAIDGSLMSNNPSLNFAIISFANYIEVIIRNTIDHEDIKLERIYTTGYSTKENHEGLGLATVREIIDSKDNLLLQTKIKDGYYSTILTILKGK